MSIAFVFVIGLIAGWYVNMVAHRIPVGESLARSPECPICHEPIRGRDSIPVVSWFLLGGTCRDCSAPIPVRYPIVELATGSVFALVAAAIGFNWVLPAYLVFVFVTMTLILTDLDWKRIPNSILFRGGGVAALLLVIGSFIMGLEHLLLVAFAGGAIHFVFMLIVALLARGGMGMGDVKLAALLGVFTAYISWRTLVVSMISGILIGGLIGVVLLVSRRKGRKDEVPYGPPLILGSWLAIVWGQTIGLWMFGG